MLQLGRRQGGKVRHSSQSIGTCAVLLGSRRAS
jgi:hypothetical protein